MRRIILLSDGTGNAAATVWRTNVWRTFEGIDLSNSDQIAFYDDGVGTSSFMPLAILGGAFGYGLKRNVLDIYKFLCRNYQTKADYAKKTVVSETDEIYAFGFSRGAFTIRTVVGLVADQGLVTYETEGELETKARAAYRKYRSEHFKTKFRIEVIGRFIRNRFVSAEHDRQQRPVESITFLGLWDTVAAYGLPVDEMARGVSRYLFPLELPGRILTDKVLRACHALSLDDERTTFHPMLWDETNEPTQKGDEWDTANERITQVWFAGVHANVGGGYPDDSLACVPLTWIMQEANATGLRFKQNPQQEPDALRRSRSSADKDGRLYDSRSGLGGYYRYGPRDVYQLCHTTSDDARENVNVDLPKIHHTALDRIKLNAHLYAPIGLPKKYALVDSNRKVFRTPGAAYETVAAANLRKNDQELVWNTVWRRRVIYFLSVVATIYLVAYPLFWIVKPHLAPSKLRFITDIIGFFAALLPTAAERWPRAYTSDPFWFLEWLGIVAALLLIGSKLKASVTDDMHAAWDRSLCGGAAPNIAALTKRSKLWFYGCLCVLFVSLYLWLIDPTAHYLINPTTVAWIKGNPSDGVIDRVREWLANSLNALPSALSDYMTSGLAFLGVLTTGALLIPDRAIQSMRNWPAYKNSIWFLRMRAAPAFFAALFVYLAIAFPNHLLMNVRDGLGTLCDMSSTNWTELADTKTVYFDIGTNRMVDANGQYIGEDHGDQLCFATGIKIVRDARYLFEIETAAEPNELKATEPPDKTSRRIARWTFFGNLSSTGGVSTAGTRQAYPTNELPVTAREVAKSTTGVPTPGESVVRMRMASQGVTDGFALWKKAAAVMLYPFKRSLDRPWGSIIVRFGAAGNEEDFIDPDPAAPSEFQSEDLPKEAGEIFIYTNKPVSGFWYTELWPNYLVRSTGIAKVTIQKKKK